MLQVSVEPDSGISFEFEMNFDVGIPSTVPDEDEGEGSKIIAVAEMTAHNPDLTCDKYKYKRKGCASESSSRRSFKSVMKARSDITERLIDEEEKLSVDMGCENWMEESGPSKESLIDGADVPFEPKPYSGVREWL